MPVSLERQTGESWTAVAHGRADAEGRFVVRYRPRGTGRHRLRVTAPFATSEPFAVRVRDVTLAAFGDVNFGDGVAAVFGQRGVLWPWGGVARTLRGADVAFGNLECSISRRGAAVPKEFNFRGRPSRRSPRWCATPALTR